MALHPNFPRSPYETLPPDLRWFPAAEELRSTAYEKLLPPLVAKVLSLLMAWCYFHKLYETGSALARNFLLIAHTPDFIVRTTNGEVWIVETKGREEIDLPQKMARLRQWCEDATEASKPDTRTKFGFVYVDQAGFEAHKPGSFAALLTAFRDYQEYSP